MTGRILAMVAILLVGCQTQSGSATAPVLSPTPAAYESPSSVPGAGTNPTTAVRPAAIKCSSPIPLNHPLALVNLYGIEGAAVRDLVDFNHPYTVCSLPACDNVAGCQHQVETAYTKPLFVSSTRISYFAADASASALFVFDMQTGSTTPELAARGFLSIGPMAWSPDGARLTYLLFNQQFVAEWHIVVAARDTTLATLNGQVSLVGFSADGLYVAENDYVESSSTGTIRVRRSASGSKVKEIVGADDAVWAASGSRLYFHGARGIQSWDAATGEVSDVLADTWWSQPQASADGRLVAYVGAGGVSLLDLTTRQVRPIKATGRLPRFLTPNLIWESAGDQKYIYDIAAGVEYPSIDYLFFDSWPRAMGAAA